MSRLKPHKGYNAVVDLDADAKIFNGRVIDLRDVIQFQGASVSELEKAFREAVDDYLEWCSELGEEPEKPYSGRVLVRMPPEMHKALAYRAEFSGASINSIVVAAIEEQLDDTTSPRHRGEAATH